MYELSIKYKKYKVGFALDISDHEKFIETDKYMQYHSIYEWEKQFWQSKINHNKYELYNADIGRNSLIISTILDNSNQLVVLECNKDSAKTLEHNKI